MASSRAKAARFIRGNALGLVALFVALGGTSYAASQLPKNSVGNKQIKNGAVTSKKIKSGSISTSKIKNGSIESGDIKAGVIPTIPSTATPTDGSVTAAKLGKLPAARLSVSSGVTQAVPSGPPSTFALFGTTDYNNDNLFTVGTSAGGSTLTVPTTGVYVITAQVNWFDDALTTGTPAVRVDNGLGNRSLFLFGNGGANNYGGSTIAGVADDFTRQSVSAVASLTAGTPLSVVVGQTSGVPLMTRGSQGQVSFSASLLSR